MELALSFKKLNKIIKKKYNHNDQRIVGIMLGRSNIETTLTMIRENFEYWDINTDKHLDIFWPGYGRYLSRSDQTATRVILDYNGNFDNIYFDLKAFHEFKKEIEKCYNSHLEDKLYLILVNYRDGQLHFNESIKISLGNNQDFIREIIDYITEICKGEHNVQDIASKIHRKQFINSLPITDVINIATGIIGLIK